jgi:hypothetical protein
MTAPKPGIAGLFISGSPDYIPCLNARTGLEIPGVPPQLDVHGNVPDISGE